MVKITKRDLEFKVCYDTTLPCRNLSLDRLRGPDAEFDQFCETLTMERLGVDLLLQTV